MKGGEMQISLFNCKAERNRINKGNYLNNRLALNGTFRDESSMIEPIIRIERNNPIPYGYNYMYIDEFKRWYFINDIVSVRNNLWEIHAKVDPLYSFASDIRSSECIIDKVEDYDKANLYFDDGSFVTDCRKDNQLIEFSNGFNENGEYILICAGGV